MSAENDLTAKIGPLPAWAWGAIVVGGVLVFRWWRGRHAAATTPVTDVAPADPNADPSTVTSTDPFTSALDSYLASDPTNPAFPVNLTNGPGGTPGPVTDAQWAKLAGDYLIGLGGVPSAIESALANYVQGLPLSADQTSIVDAALQHFGSPPEGVLSVVASPGAAPPPSGGTVDPSPTPSGATGGGTTTVAAALSLSQDGPPGKTTIPVHWTAYPGATGYEVYLDSKLHGTTTRLSTVLGGMTPGTQHSIYIVAVRGSVVLSVSNHLTGVRTAS